LVFDDDSIKGSPTGSFFIMAEQLDFSLQGLYDLMHNKMVWPIGLTILLAGGVALWVYGVKDYQPDTAAQWSGSLVAKEAGKDWLAFFSGGGNKQTAFYWKVKLDNGQTRWIYAESGRMWQLSKKGDPIRKKEGEAQARLMSDRAKQRREELEKDYINMPG
jgi:hypothetical protein